MVYLKKSVINVAFHPNNYDFNLGFQSTQQKKGIIKKKPSATNFRVKINFDLSVPPKQSPKSILVDIKLGEKIRDLQSDFLASLKVQMFLFVGRRDSYNPPPKKKLRTLINIKI